MRYLIKTNLHLNLGCNKFLIGSCGMRVGAVLADEATARFSDTYRRQVSELSHARQSQLGADSGQGHSEIHQPFRVAVPQPVRDDFVVEKDIPY